MRFFPFLKPHVHRLLLITTDVSYSLDTSTVVNTLQYLERCGISVLVKWKYNTIVFQGWRTKAFGKPVPTRQKIARYLHIYTLCPAGFEHQHTQIAQRGVHWIIDENVRVIYAIKVCGKKMRFRFFFTSQIFWSNGLFVIDLFREGRYIIMLTLSRETIQ